MHIYAKVRTQVPIYGYAPLFALPRARVCCNLITLRSRVCDALLTAFTLSLCVRAVRARSAKQSHKLETNVSVWRWSPVFNADAESRARLADLIPAESADMHASYLYKYTQRVIRADAVVHAPGTAEHRERNEKNTSVKQP